MIDWKLRLCLILAVMLSGYVIGDFVGNKEAGFVDYLNLGLSLFNIFGAICLMRLEREKRM